MKRTIPPKLILSEIKIGRNTYQIKKGDFILDNGNCFQFCTGDRRVLYYEKYSDYTSIIIPKSILKKIPLSKLKKMAYHKFDYDMYKYFF